MEYDCIGRAQAGGGSAENMYDAVLEKGWLATGKEEYEFEMIDWVGV